ncbi:hypothetical protein WG66_005822 [Moniliophthora roreri]|nr:hypothetical protein WG66_005822 [Moniliophthora roreri]
MLHHCLLLASIFFSEGSGRILPRRLEIKLLFILAWKIRQNGWLVQEESLDVLAD